MNAEREPAQEAVFGSPEWTAAFMDAVKQAVSDAVEEHLSAGNPVYFTDDEGDICELSQTERSASSSARKLISSSPSQILPDH